MILNGYDTFVGKRVSVSDDIPTTLKTLSTTNRLKTFGRISEIKLVDAENGQNIKPFIFPMSLTDFRGNKVTVVDTRHYVNSAGKTVNPAEFNMMLVAALLQQAVYKGNKGTLLATRQYALKAFAKSISSVLQRGLTFAQKLDLEIILGHYYNCLLTSNGDDYLFVSQNALKQAINVQPNTSYSVISEIGYINTFKDLVDTIKSYPTLSVLSKLDLGGFIGTVNQTWMITSGFREITGASVEMPHLYTAMCYASITNNIYKKTAIGREVDPRENPKVSHFVSLINQVWPE